VWPQQLYIGHRRLWLWRWSLTRCAYCGFVHRGSVAERLGLCLVMEVDGVDGHCVLALGADVNMGLLER